MSLVSAFATPLIKKVIFRDILFYFCVSFALAFTTLIGLSTYGYRVIQNTIEDQERSRALKAVSYQLEALETLTQSYSHWDEAYLHLVKTLKPQWALDNIGYELFENFHYEVAAVINEKRDVVLAFENGRAMEEEQKEHLASFFKEMIKIQPSYKGIVRIGDSVYLVAISLIQPLRNVPDIHERAQYLFVAQKFSDKLFSALSSMTHLKEFQLLDENSQNVFHKIPLQEEGGGVTYLSWAPSTDVPQLLQQVLPYGLLALILLSLLSIVVVRRLIRAGANYETLFEELAISSANLIQAKVTSSSYNDGKLRFLGMISHEIRTPLNGIVSAVSLLKETNLSEEQQTSIQTLDKAVANLMRLLTDISDFTKLQAKQVHLEPSQVSLRTFLTEVYAQLEPLATNKKLIFEVSLAEKVPPVVEVDPLRLRQIFLHLVSNAVKFTPHGRVCVDVSVRSVTPTTCDLYVRVTDTGIGIPKVLRDVLFNDFFQVDPAQSRPYEGPGLGLSLAKNLVSLMGGSIGLDTSVEAGSVFWFSVPVKILS